MDDPRDQALEIESTLTTMLARAEISRGQFVAVVDNRLARTPNSSTVCEVRGIAVRIFCSDGGNSDHGITDRLRVVVRMSPITNPGHCR
jgi:hypothetical protein